MTAKGGSEYGPGESDSWRMMSFDGIDALDRGWLYARCKEKDVREDGQVVAGSVN